MNFNIVILTSYVNILIYLFTYFMSVWFISNLFALLLKSIYSQCQSWVKGDCVKPQ